VSVLQSFRDTFQQAISDDSLAGDASRFSSRNAGRQALRAANAAGVETPDYGSYQRGLPGGGDRWRVGPGGVGRANEKPGVQGGETIALTRVQDGEHVEEVDRTLPSDVSGFVRVGDVVDAPSGAADTVLFIEPDENYQPDTAGSELAAGEEGTATDPIADAVSRATNGDVNAGPALRDVTTTASSTADTASMAGGSLGVLAVVAVIVAWVMTRG